MKGKTTENSMQEITRNFLFSAFGISEKFFFGDSRVFIKVFLPLSNQSFCRKLFKDAIKIPRWWRFSSANKFTLLLDFLINFHPRLVAELLRTPDVSFFADRFSTLVLPFPFFTLSFPRYHSFIPPESKRIRLKIINFTLHLNRVINLRVIMQFTSIIKTMFFVSQSTTM